MEQSLVENSTSNLQFRFETTNKHICNKAIELEQQLIKDKKYKRNRGRDFAHAFNVILTCVEVYQGYEDNRWLRITTGNNAFSGKTAKGSEYTSEQKEAVKFLIKHGYLEKRDGVRQIKSAKKKFKRKPAWLPIAYVITPKWRDELFNEPQCANHEIIRNHLASYIILRDTRYKTTKTSKSESYKAVIPITQAHRTANAEMFCKTSELLKTHDTIMANTTVSLGTKAIPSAQAFMRRIFSRNSFELGGRFYHDLQNRTSDTRRYLRLNNEPTVEVDYSGIHPSFLYAMAGIRLEADKAYSVDGFSRDDSKIAFNILINRNGTKDGSYGAVANNLEIRNEEAKRLVDGLYEANKVISEHFNTGYGLKLQYIDSLMAMAVIDLFVNQMKQPILSIHDSFIVSVRDTEDLILTMVDAYRIVGEAVLHDDAMLSGIKTECLDFSDRMMNAIDRCCKQQTEGMDTEYWDALIAEEPVQECPIDASSVVTDDEEFTEAL
jgi:hypothetical protein